MVFKTRKQLFNFMNMKNIGLLLIAGLMVISCNQTPKSDVISKNENAINATAERDGVFIHITESYNDPHKVLMPLKMAVLMSQDKDVIVYLDIHAVELVVNYAKDLSFAGFETFQTYLKQLSDAKVGVYACPTCLEVAGLKQEDLMTGVQIAQKDKFFDFTKGRILTLDY